MSALPVWKSTCNFKRCFTLWEFVGSIKTPECTHQLEKLAIVTPKRHLVTCLNTSLSHFCSQNESSAAGSLPFSASFFVSCHSWPFPWDGSDLKRPSCSFLSAGDYRCTALSPAPLVPLPGPRTSLPVSNALYVHWCVLSTSSSNLTFKVRSCGCLSSRY